MRRTMIAGLCLLTWAASAAADDRRVVAVRVEVIAPSFRRELVPPGQTTSREVEEAERGAARQIADALNEPPSFLRFDLGGTAATLTIRVISKAPANARTSLQEVGLAVDVAGTDVARGDPAYWTLRPQDDIRAAPGTGRELAKEISEKVGANVEALLRDVLSRVPIAASSAMLKDPWGWIIPFTPQDICIDLRSRFAISSEIQQSIGRRALDLPAEFTVVFDPPAATAFDDQRHRIFTGALDHPDLALLKQAGAASVKAVRVTQYLRLRDGCGRQPSPAEAFR